MPVSRRAMLAGSAAAVAAPPLGIAVPELRRSAGGKPWTDLIVTSDGANLRAFSPQNGIVYNSPLLSGYYDGYVTRAWNKYEPTTLTIDTRASYGTVTGQVTRDRTRRARLRLPVRRRDARRRRQPGGASVKRQSRTAEHDRGPRALNTLHRTPRSTVARDLGSFLMTSTGAEKEAGHARHVAIRHTAP